VEKGEFWNDGKKVKITRRWNAKRSSIGLVPEDRKDEGLPTEFTVMKISTITN
jgi:ABC-type sugar transport system ATPase subunit